MSLMQVRNWRRTHRRQRAHRRALNNLLWTSCRLMAIGLIGVAFLFYRLDMPGTHTYFTADAYLGSAIMQMGVWADEVEVEYSRGDGQFHTRATNSVIFIIKVANVDIDSVYLTYKGKSLSPSTCIYNEEAGAVYAKYENHGNNMYFGDFLNRLLEQGEAQEIVVTIHWKLTGEDIEHSHECLLKVFAPSGHVNVEFEVLSASGRTLAARDATAKNDASAEEWLVANIQLLEGGSAADIDINSIRLVYDESYLEPERSELAGDTLRVYFNRSVVDAWLQGLGVQGGEVLLTITGEMITDDGTLPFSASNYYQMQMAIEGEEPVSLNLHIEGSDVIIIPAEGEVTETYTAVVLDAEGQEVPDLVINWSLEGETAGVTVADGMVTVTSEAVEGSFTLTAALVGWEEINDTIAVQLLADAGGGAAGPPAGEVPPGEGELPPEGGEEPLPEGEEPPVDEEDSPSEGEGEEPTAGGEDPPVDGGEPPADGEPENEEEPGEKPPEEGGEPEDDGEVPPEEEAIREDDEDGGGNTGDQDGGDDDHRGPGGGGEEALPREDDEDGGGAYEGQDGSNAEPDPEKDGGPAETGRPGQESDGPGKDEKGSGGDVGTGGGQSEAGQGGSEPAGQNDDAGADA